MNSMLASSPLEALAFDYVSFGLINVVNSLWTWLAVVTAAVSFWRLRPKSLEGFKHHAPPSSNDVVKCSNGCSPFPQTSPCTTVSSPSPSPSHVALPSSSVRFQDNIDGGLTKGGKFTLYFDEGRSNGEVDDDGEDEAEMTEESGGESWWEGGLRMRIEEKSWYRCQDLRVFNGNVVRLWDNNSHGFRVRCFIYGRLA